MIILKNAYLFKFNRDNDFGRFSVLISENKISDIAESNAKGESKVEKWIELHPNAEVIDCSKKMIMPPFVNSCVKSEGSLFHYLLKKKHYERSEEDLCTDMIFNYMYSELPGEETKEDLSNIYNYSYTKLLKSGVTAFNEFSLRKDANHLPLITNSIKKTGLKSSVCYPVKQDHNTIRDYKFLNPSYYLTQENNITVFDISGITELRSHGLRNLFLEVAVNKDVTESFKMTFHKSIIAVLDEYGLIDENTSLINPLYLDYNDFKIITDRKANVIICPRDLNFFSNKYFPVDDYIGHGIKYSIGTGWLGEDLFKDVRLFRNKYKELNISSVDLLMSVSKVPYSIYFDPDIGKDACMIEINKQADLIMVDLSDSRFQFFPEDNDFESVCDFIIDNVSGFNVSDVILNGKFTVRNNKPVEINEDDVILKINQTRERLYTVGKYDELKKKRITRRNSELIDMSGRTSDEIKLFSEPQQEDVLTDAKEEFRIKTKIPVFRQKTTPGQRSLFDENEFSPVLQSDDFIETPEINLLTTDFEIIRPEEEDIIQAKTIDEVIIKRIGSDKKSDNTKMQNTESKVELPKNVKLKFGDD